MSPKNSETQICQALKAWVLGALEVVNTDMLKVVFFVGTFQVQSLLIGALAVAI